MLISESLLIIPNLIKCTNSIVIPVTQYYSVNEHLFLLFLQDFSDIYFNCISSRNPSNKDSYGIRVSLTK